MKKTPQKAVKGERILSADSLHLIWRAIDCQLAELEKLHWQFAGRSTEKSASDGSPPSWWLALNKERRDLEKARDQVAVLFESQFLNESYALKALTFYADYDNILWEDAGTGGVEKKPMIYRYAISGTERPREVARRAIQNGKL